jgi:hypothetical protein
MAWSKERQAAYMKGYSVRNAAARKKYKDAWYQANKVRLLKRQSEWRAENRDKRLKRDAVYRVVNAAKLKISKALWSASHPRWHGDWCKRNSDKCVAYVQARRARKMNATPKWANKFFIDEIYHLAKLRTKMLGSEWHVDHIVPLKSKRVCGLHVENNLRVIPATQNLEKHNSHWPDM